MTRMLAPLRLAALLFLLMALVGAYHHRELLSTAAPADLTVLLVCLFLPFIPLLLTPTLAPSKERRIDAP